jgi:hypothetical protein
MAEARAWRAFRLSWERLAWVERLHLLSGGHAPGDVLRAVPCSVPRPGQFLHRPRPGPRSTGGQQVARAPRVLRGARPVARPARTGDVRTKKVALK